MPPLDRLAAPRISLATRVWMGALRAYLLIAVALVLYKLYDLAVHGGAGAAS